MWFVVGLGAVLLILALIIAGVHDDSHAGACLSLAVVGTVFIIAGSAVLATQDSITPMDVYQGHTTLEYKVVDGKVVDSTVVWKPEYKKDK